MNLQTIARRFCPGWHLETSTEGQDHVVSLTPLACQNPAGQIHGLDSFLEGRSRHGQPQALLDLAATHGARLPGAPGLVQEVFRVESMAEIIVDRVRPNWAPVYAIVARRSNELAANPRWGATGRGISMLIDRPTRDALAAMGATVRGSR